MLNSLVRKVLRSGKVRTLLETSGSPQRAWSILSNISILEGGLNIKSLAGNNPCKSNHVNRTFIALGQEIDSTYQITDFIVNVSVLN